jgi:serine/threonine-protein kinase
MAVPFNTADIQVTGAPVPLVERVLDSDVRTGAMHFTVSLDGSLAYLSGGSSEQSALAWVTRDGTVQPLPSRPLPFGGPRISPDGTRIAVDVERNGNFDVLVYDIARNVLTPLAFSPAREQYPMWTGDGNRVVFYSDADGGGLYSKASDGTGAVERLTSTSSLQLPSAWSADGRTLVIQQTTREALANFGSRGPSDILALSLDPGSEVRPLLQSATQPALSPDSRWLAYAESPGGSGRNVYVRPFPKVDGSRSRLSIDGGTSPLWSPDGKSLYYISQSKALVVPIETTPTFRAGQPTVLFDLPRA